MMNRFETYFDANRFETYFDANYTYYSNQTDEF